MPSGGSAAMTDVRRLLGEILLDQGCVDQSQIDAALEKQMNGDSRKIGEIFISEGLCQEADITAALAEQFGMEMVDLGGVEISREVTDLLPRETCQENHVMPIDLFDGVLTL